MSDMPALEADEDYVPGLSDDDDESDEFCSDDDEIAAGGTGAGAVGRPRGGAKKSQSSHDRLSKPASTKETAPRQIPTIQSIHCGCFLGRAVDVKLVARKTWNAAYDPRSINGVSLGLRSPACKATVFASGKVICLGARSESDALLACRKFCRLVQRIKVDKVHPITKQIVSDYPYQECTFTKFKVHNVSASGALGYRVDLYGISVDKRLSDFSDYEPEQFPGLYYRLPVVDGVVVSERIESESEKKANARAAAAHRQAVIAWQQGYGEQPDKMIFEQQKLPTVTASVFSNGKLTITGARSEREVYQAFELLSSILFPFNQGCYISPSSHLSPPSMNNYTEWLAWSQNLSQTVEVQQQLLAEAQEREEEESQRRAKRELREMQDKERLQAERLKMDREAVKAQAAAEAEAEAKTVAAAQAVLSAAEGDATDEAGGGGGDVEWE